MLRERVSRGAAALAFASVMVAAEPAASAEPALFQPQVTGLSLVVIRTGTRDGWRRLAVLQEPWFYCSKVSGDPASRPPGHGELYAVPAGYVTDFASIPGWARAWTPPFGAWAEAAVIHDWLHDIGAPGRRREVDAIFREALQDMQVSRFRRTVMHLAVRAGGGDAYREAGKRDPEVWRTHFVDRQGEPLPQPPFEQPAGKTVFKTSFDCSRLERPTDVDALRAEYEALYPRARLQ
jgi:hypothetical protein